MLTAALRTTALLALLWFIVGLAPTGIAAAAGAPGTSAADIPPNFHGTVCATRTAPPTGGVLSCTYKGDVIQVTIPQGAAAGSSLEIILSFATVPGLDVSNARHLFAPILAYRIQLVELPSNVDYVGSLDPPATVSLADPSIARGDQVSQYVNGQWSAVTNARVNSGHVHFSIANDPVAVVLAPLESVAVCTAHCFPATQRTTALPAASAASASSLHLSVGHVVLAILILLAMAGLGLTIYRRHRSV